MYSEINLEQHALYAPDYVFYADSEDLVDYMGNEYAVEAVRIRHVTAVEVLPIVRQQQQCIH